MIESNYYVFIILTTDNKKLLYYTNDEKKAELFKKESNLDYYSHLNTNLDKIKEHHGLSNLIELE